MMYGGNIFINLYISGLERSKGLLLKDGNILCVAFPDCLFDELQILIIAFPEQEKAVRG